MSALSRTWSAWQRILLYFLSIVSSVMAMRRKHYMTLSLSLSLFRSFYLPPPPSLPPSLPPDPPSAIISNFQQSSMSLSVAMMVGETAPLFTCTSSGYPEPTITWLYEGAFSSDHENGLPDGVILADASREMEARELLWQRALQYTDSGTYRCTASNGFGTSDATLDLLVRCECTCRFLVQLRQCAASLAQYCEVVTTYYAV